MARLFLNAQEGSFAFQKEQDSPDWENSIYAAAAQSGGGDDWTSDPTTDFAAEVTAGRVLDVRNIRRATIALKPTGTPGSYDFTVKNGYTSPNSSSAMEDWYDLDGGVYTGESGNLFVGVDTLGLDYICVVLDSLTTYTAMSIELTAIPYEVNE